MPRAPVLLVSLLLAACGFSPGGGSPLDSDDVAPDASVTSPDAAGERRLGLNSPCDPLWQPAGGCAEGLTCRPRLGADSGLCRPVGALAAGAACTVVEGDECAFGAACAIEPPAFGGWCVTVCAAGAADGCPTGQTCEAWWSPTVGRCR